MHRAALRSRSSRQRVGDGLRVEPLDAERLAEVDGVRPLEAAALQGSRSARRASRGVRCWPVVVDHSRACEAPPRVRRPPSTCRHPSWDRCVRPVELEGPEYIVRTFPKWLGLHPFAQIERPRRAAATQRFQLLVCGMRASASVRRRRSLWTRRNSGRRPCPRLLGARERRRARCFRSLRRRQGATRARIVVRRRRIATERRVGTRELSPEGVWTLNGP
jgi:hypothetical protein